MGLGGLKIKPNSSPRSAESLLVTRKNLLSPDPAPFMGLTKDRPLLEERGNGKAASTVSPPSLKDKISFRRGRNGILARFGQFRCASGASALRRSDSDLSGNFVESIFKPAFRFCQWLRSGK